MRRNRFSRSNPCAAHANAIPASPALRFGSERRTDTEPTIRHSDAQIPEHREVAAAFEHVDAGRVERDDGAGDASLACERGNRRPPLRVELAPPCERIVLEVV